MNPNRKISLSLVALALIVLLNAVALSNELVVSRLDTNDSVDHFLNVQGMVNAIEHGGNPLDWFTQAPFGYPVIRDYQPFAYVLVALLYFALGKSISLLGVFVLVRYLSMALLPLSFYACARGLGFQRWTAVAVAILGPTLTTNMLYGLEYESYVWQGFGMFTQMVGANLFLLTLGMAFRAIRRGRPLMLAGLMLGVTFVTHLIYGYMGAATLCLLALLPDQEVPRLTRIRRTVAIGAVSFVVSLFELVPLWLDGRLLNQSALDVTWKSDSYGAATVLKLLFTGEITDHGRLPVLALLALAGIAVLLWRYRKTKRIDFSAKFVLAAALFWLLVFFGRPTWGPLIYLLGIPREMHLHRVMAALQLFLVLLAAVGLAAIWKIVEKQSRLAAAVVVLLILSPLIYDRVAYLDQSRNRRTNYLALIDQERPDLDAILRTVKARGGYVYAGLSTNWGNIFRVGGSTFYSFLAANDVAQTSFAYHAIEMPTAMMMSFDEVQPAEFRLFDVRSVITPAAVGNQVPAFLKPILAVGRFRVFAAPGNGYFDVVDTLAAIPADRTTFYGIDNQWLHSDLVAKRGHLLLDFFGNAPPGVPRTTQSAGLPDDPYSTPPGEVSSEQHSGDIFQATLNAVRPAYALFRMTWHQNWKATLDGRAAPTYMLSPGFIGVPVPAGTHNIEFRYVPDNWRVPLALAGFLIAGLLVAAEQTGKLRFAQTEIAVAPEPEPEPETVKPAEPARAVRTGSKIRRGSKAKR